MQIARTKVRRFHWSEPTLGYLCSLAPAFVMGPGVGYFGGGGVSLILLIVIFFLFFGRGRSKL